MLMSSMVLIKEETIIVEVSLSLSGLASFLVLVIIPLPHFSVC